MIHLAAISELGTRGNISKFREALTHNDEFIENKNSLNFSSLNYLLYNSSYISIHNSRQEEKYQLLLIMMIGKFLSGFLEEIVIPENAIKHGFLLEGTNLYFSENTKKLHISLRKFGNKLKLHINSMEFEGEIKSGKIIIDDSRNEFNITFLPFNSSKILFFKEEYDQQKQEIYTLIDEEETYKINPILAKAFDFLESDNSIIPADFIEQQVHYISFTDINQHESSSDPRHAKGVITINLRDRFLSSETEIISWFIHGLVHEAKHLQFFDLFLGQNEPHTNWIKSSTIQLTSDWGIRVPCAWRGTPSLRSMADHLLALQAFIPGIIALLNYLDHNSEKYLSTWLRDHIELELRVINGAIGTLILGRDYLTEEGNYLFNIIQTDYRDILVPLLQKVDPQSRY